MYSKFWIRILFLVEALWNQISICNVNSSGPSHDLGNSLREFNLKFSHQNLDLIFTRKMYRTANKNKGKILIPSAVRNPPICWSQINLAFALQTFKSSCRLLARTTDLFSDQLLKKQAPGQCSGLVWALFISVLDILIGDNFWRNSSAWKSRAPENLIRGHYNLVWCDLSSILSGMFWAEVSLVWHLNLGF